MKKRTINEMTEKQAERIIECYDNASKNGEEWMHNVYLHRGTARYEKNVETLNEAFRLKNIDKIVQQMPGAPAARNRRKTS